MSDTVPQAPDAATRATIPRKDPERVSYWKMFGGLVARRRRERDLSEAELAHLVVKRLEREQVVTGDTIVSWERNDSVPYTDEIFDALAHVLIEQNKKIAPGDKPRKLEEFRAAYIEAKDNLGRTFREKTPSSFKFGKLITEHRREIGVVEDRLAVLVQRKRGTSQDEKQLDQINGDFIIEVQSGRGDISQRIANAIIYSLNVTPRTHVRDDEGGSLSGEEIAELNAAFLELVANSKGKAPGYRRRADRGPGIAPGS